MRTKLLRSGTAALAAQAVADPAAKLSFSKFALADGEVSFDSINLDAVGPVGTVLYTGVPADMTFSKMDSSELLLSITVEHDKNFGRIGNMVLYVKLGLIEYPFSMSVPNSNNSSLHKLKSETKAAGLELKLHLMLKVPGLFDIFQVTGMVSGNLTEQSIPMMTFADQTEIVLPKTAHREVMLLERHTVLNRPVQAFLAPGGWWGITNMSRLDDAQIASLDGGDQGDEYKYVIEE